MVVAGATIHFIPGLDLGWSGESPVARLTADS
jgi:hypothetical protein